MYGLGVMTSVGRTTTALLIDGGDQHCLFALGPDPDPCLCGDDKEEEDEEEDAGPFSEVDNDEVFC